MPAEGPGRGPAISAWEVLASAEQDKQVQVLLRAIALEYRESMALHWNEFTEPIKCTLWCGRRLRQ